MGTEIRPEKADIRPEKVGHWARYKYLQTYQDMFISLRIIP